MCPQWTRSGASWARWVRTFVCAIFAKIFLKIFQSVTDFWYFKTYIEKRYTVRARIYTNVRTRVLRSLFRLFFSIFFLIFFIFIFVSVMVKNRKSFRTTELLAILWHCAWCRVVNEDQTEQGKYTSPQAQWINWRSGKILRYVELENSAFTKWSIRDNDLLANVKFVTKLSNSIKYWKKKNS